MHYTGAMKYRPLAYSLLVFLVFMARSWIGAQGTVVILLVILAWTLWDVLGEWEADSDDDDDND